MSVMFNCWSQRIPVACAPGYESPPFLFQFVQVPDRDLAFQTAGGLNTICRVHFSEAVSQTLTPLVAEIEKVSPLSVSGDIRLLKKSPLFSMSNSLIFLPAAS